MKQINSVETTFVKGSLRYKGAPDEGLQLTVPFVSKQKEIEEYDRNVVVNLADLYDKERQKSGKFIPSCKIQFIFQNLYSGLTNGSSGQVYTPFNNSLYFVDEEYFRTQSVIENGEQIEIPWGGYPQFEEFLFYRKNFNTNGYTSGNNPHIRFKKRDAGKYNWNIHMTYAYSSDTNVQMSYEKDGVTIPFICGNGIPYIMSINTSGGKNTISFDCPVNHGLSVGDYVLLDFEYAGQKMFEVYSLGNGLFNSDKKIFSILNIGYNLPQRFFPNRQGQFKRVLNPDLSGETTSEYYVRVHKNLTHVSASTVTLTGFEQNAFRTVRKLLSPAAQPNIANPITKVVTKDGSESYNISFKDVLNIKNILDNQTRPLSKIYLTVINRGEFGWFNPLILGTNTALKQGWGFNIGSGITSWWARGNSDSSTNLQTQTYTYNLNDVEFNFNYNEGLNIGDLVYGDFCEWNDYEQTERVISNYYQKIVYNPTLFVIDTNQNNPAGYYYQSHHPFTIRAFSDYIEEGGSEEVYGIPNYAYYSETNNSFFWRDLYDYGFIDSDGIGVDFPFMNGKHYPYENFIFKLIPEGTYSPQFAINSVKTPLVDGCE